MLPVGAVARICSLDQGSDRVLTEHTMTSLRKLVALLTFMAALGVASPVFAASPTAGSDDKQLVHNLLETMIKDDYEGFMSHVTPDFGNVAARDFMFIAAQMGPRLAQGYELEYFGMLQQLGYDISVWKISFSDDNDDVLATLNVRDGKVAGFFMQ